MKKIGFWFVKALAYLIAITPFGLLYLRSDRKTILPQPLRFVYGNM